MNKFAQEPNVYASRIAWKQNDVDGGRSSNTISGAMEHRNATTPLKKNIRKFVGSEAQNNILTE